MRKYWALVVVLLLAFCAVVIFYPALAYVPLGHLNHEAFFEGKPTSYWTRAVKGEGFLGHGPPGGDVGQTLTNGGRESVGVLTQMLQDADRNVRRQALLALFHIGADAKPAASTLASMAKNEDVSVLFLAEAAALAKADPEVECQTLATVLRDKSNPDRRGWALAVLLDSASHCQAILPAVLEVFQENDKGLRVDTIRVLGRMQQPPEPLVEALCAILNTDQIETSGVQAVEALGELGPGAKASVPLLIKILQSPSTRSSGRNFGPPHLPGVVIALGRIGKDANASVPALESLLAKAHDDELRRHTREALEKIRPPAK
jgi:HEAT repeat protein